MKEYIFKQAVPVWEKKKETEMNYHLLFRSIISEKEIKECVTKIALTASNMYQLFVNGRFVAEGPARAGHGYYRVDEIDISQYLTAEKNVVAVYVAGYYIKNFYLIKQPSFICAEILCGDRIVAATGSSNNGGFEAMYHSARFRKVARYSYQRPFCEAYELDEAYQALLTDADKSIETVELAEVEQKDFLEREAPYPCYDFIAAQKLVAKGNVTFVEEPIKPVRTTRIFMPDPELAFKRAELEISNCDEISKGIYQLEETFESGREQEFLPLELKANTFSILALPTEKTGFITLELEVTEDTQFMVGFDEILTEGDVALFRMQAINSVIWKLKKGKYSLITNEPYSMKYLKLINKSENAVVKVSKVGITEFAFDYHDDGLKSDNAVLNRIYDAGVETFRQNTVDIYMDCPSRERAGWLCDSFFTSRVEYELTGKSAVEKNFLENFIFSKEFNGVDEGMLPMCYPADFAKSYIPQWAMWYVLELEEYLERTKDRQLIKDAMGRIRDLLSFFERYENEDGLLEKLPSWNFVEWSKANEFVQDVNYPTNMLYARMLRAVAKVYGKENAKYAEHMPAAEQCLKKAMKIVETVREQSYFDGFFHDHALRQEDGSLLVVKEDVTETCQYYAFFFETATPEIYPELWKTLLEDFGPGRVEKGLWKGIYPSNAFIGYYLRLELLSRAELGELLLENIEGFFGYMAARTGTLWEHNDTSASCNHGFASHVLVWLRKFVK